MKRQNGSVRAAIASQLLLIWLAGCGGGSGSGTATSPNPNIDQGVPVILFNRATGAQAYPDIIREIVNAAQ